ncbi:MAG: hypothetical protein ACE5RT_03030, partial [Nitrosopumilaceae archaeon]
MNKIIIPVIASVLILGSFGLSQDVFAPPPQKPEKINAGPVKWDGVSNNFEIKLLVHLHKDSD